MIPLYCNTKIIILMSPNVSNEFSNHAKPFLSNIFLLDNGSANIINSTAITPEIKNIFMLFTPFF